MAACSHSPQTEAKPPASSEAAVAAATLTVYGILNRYLPGRQGTVRINLTQRATVGDVLARLGLPVEILAVLLLNGTRASPDALVAPGDLIEAFPACGGGSAKCRVQSAAPCTVHSGLWSLADG